MSSAPTPPSVHAYHFDTAIGVCGVAWSEEGLTRVQLPERDTQSTTARLFRAASSAAPTHPAPIVQAIDELQRYFRGERCDFLAVPLDTRALNPFEQRVYAELRAVPYGNTTTYGALARQIGQPGAARAIGVAMGRNPWPVIIPCHRVLAAGRALGGFSAYGGGVTKQALLRLEGAAIPEQIALPGLD